MRRSPGLSPEAGVPLAPLTTLGIGGNAGWFLRATSEEDVAAAHRWAAERDCPLFVLGGGSNLLVADGGVDGLVVQIAHAGIALSRQSGETLLRAGAGEAWDRVVETAVEAGLAGLECLSGIPGSAGGTPIQNVGAYGQEVADVLVDVSAFDRTTAAMVSLDAAACRFAYRASRFKREDAGRFIVCAVAFALRPGPPTVAYPDVTAHLRQHGIGTPTVSDVRGAVLSIRRRKGMVLDASDPDTRSVGSFFTNPVVPAAAHAALGDATGGTVPGFPAPPDGVKIPAAWLIERAGFHRGYRDGAVGLSSKHPLAIVNLGGATARDVVRLAVRIKRRVADRFGIPLVPEPVFIGFAADDDVSYLREAGG